MTDPSLRMRATVPEHVMMRELDGEAVILDVLRGQYYGLDAVGTRMWAELTKASTLEAACSALLEQYDVQPERLQEDLLELVSRLVEQGLLVLRDA